MATSGQPLHGVRDRARIVCCQCHARKVKCDLQTRSQGTCSNCYKHGLACQPRTNRRATVKERYAKQALGSPRPNGTAAQGLDRPVTPETSIIREQRDQVAVAPAPEAFHKQYLGAMTYIMHSAPSIPPNYQRITAFSNSRNQEILTIIDPTASPPTILFNAYSDAYFQHLFHQFPVIDHADLSSNRPSLALQQAICMVGTMLRHPKGPDILSDNEKYYYNAKTLIHTNHEQDPMTVLKVLCLLATRNIAGPVLLTVDCAWHWLGIAIRLLQQMGLHREEMCVASASPGMARRIAWCLFVQDKLLSGAFGRPTCIKEDEFDARPLAEEDFECPGIQPLLFMQLAKIASILGRILDLRWRAPKDIQAQHADILHSLKDWIRNLPTPIHIFDRNGVRTYRRDVFELHIVYFATIILYCDLFNDHDITSVPNIVSLVASSCIARLYHEIDCRDDLNYLLGIQNWFLTVAAMPQLLYNAAECSLPESDSYCSEELDMLVSSLEQVQTRIPGSTVILNAINRLRASRTSGPVRNPREKVFFSEGYDLFGFRDLFPFPNSLSPRLALWEVYAGDIFQGLETPLTATEDPGWISGEFADLSRLAFAGLPQPFS
ncbi:fungal-specific transcription factor domain-containing protein [Aspergillus pseudonomiae]|uniref:Fungal-specific transcription factor domain-containing protein n=1 Tax=Aspergillus pseudonomiae TaxID=1506151 RepID=A0A5N7DP78_9EURO|nr:fungal-specific transcription factor domain-containing protein [Aspergillus pseudonomiae]KAE8407803.1 fungal-specific transcription factor domain-containing protein [Aspergillus pseudonomiae]